MKKIETSVIIHSTPMQVWKVLMHFENYPSWNPFITQVKGTATVGEQIEVKLSIEKGKYSTFKPKVQQVSPSTLFEWEGHLFVRGLFDGKHRFEIILLEDNTVQFIQSEVFNGILSGTLLKMIGAKTKNGFEKMNEALKARVEGMNTISKAS